MRQNTKLYVLILAIGLPVNFVCEYLHMPLFQVTFLRGYIDSHLSLSALSASLNMVWTYLIYALMRNSFGKTWTADWNLQKVMAVVGSGMVLVCIGERTALSIGLWSYSVTMPVIPILGVGLTPFLIISTMPLVTMYLASRFA